MNYFNLNFKKVILSCTLVFATLCCLAQKPLLTYQDLQYIIQNPTTVASFLQQKDYRLQSSFNGQMVFSGLIADEEYNDVFISIKGKRTTVTLSTTSADQVEMIQKSLQTYASHNSKNSKIYRIKEAGISNLSVKMPADNAEKLYTIQLEN